MSLIHDALKSMDEPREPRRVLPPAPAAAPRSRPAWLDAVLAFVAVVAAAWLGWMVWTSQSQRSDPRAVSVVPQRNASPAAEPAKLPEPAAAPAVSTDLTRVAAATGTPAPDASTSPAATSLATGKPASTVPLPKDTSVPAAPSAQGIAQATPAQAAPRQPRPPRPAVRDTAPATMSAPAAPAVDEAPIELRFARFVAAMKESRTADAEQELALLKARLPAGSLGLMRAQAWFDLRAGRDASAVDLYRAILDRMPGDEEAAINLASIQSRQYKTEDARATLDAAARLQPDSAALRAALAQFTPSARQ